MNLQYPDLKDQNVIITGASQGIGAAIAKALAENLCRVGILARSADKLETLAETLSHINPNVYPLVADVTDPQGVQQSLVAFTQEVGPISLLVNNAGFVRDQLLLGLKPEDWNAVLDVNLTGAYHVTRLAVKDMLKLRKGSIVNVSSVVALSGNPGQSHYVAAKAGLIGFTKALARELASRNIRVNAVAPGFIRTEMTARLSEEIQSRYITQIPLGRFGEPDDVAPVVLFLLSDASRYITGTVINVSGGLYM